MNTRRLNAYLAQEYKMSRLCLTVLRIHLGVGYFQSVEN